MTSDEYIETASIMLDDDLMAAIHASEQEVDVISWEDAKKELGL